MIEYLPGIRTCHTSIWTTATAFQWVTSIDDTFSGNRKMSQPIIFFFNTCIWHRSHSVGGKRREERKKKHRINWINNSFTSKYVEQPKSLTPFQMIWIEAKRIEWSTNKKLIQQTKKKKKKWNLLFLLWLLLWLCIYVNVFLFAIMTSFRCKC